MTNSPKSLTNELNKLSLNGSFTSNNNDLSLNRDNSRSSSVDSLRRENNRTMDIMSRNSNSNNSFNKRDTNSKKNIERDRFVPNRTALESNNSNLDAELDVEYDPPLLNNDNDNSNNKRILAFAEPPPASSVSIPSTDIRLRLAKSTHSSTSSNNVNKSSTVNHNRNLSKLKPDRVLDAPGIVDDFYYNLLSWSSNNLLAVGIGSRVFVWNAGDGSVKELCNGEDTDSGDVQSLKWTDDGSYLATGWADSSIQIYDIETGRRLRKMAGHASRVGVLSWSSHILSSGSKSGQIHQHDVRIQQHKVDELNGHVSEVTGLAWKPLDGYT